MVSIVSIQADQSRRQWRLLLWLNQPMFQSYQFRQINPDVSVSFSSGSTWYQCFNRINSGRSIPTTKSKFGTLMTMAFQSYQFRQINPDITLDMLFKSDSDEVSIVSIQADQSRRDSAKYPKYEDWVGFNRINSGRSIPTRFVSITSWQTHWSFNRINSGRSIPTHGLRYGLNGKISSFNRINSGRSIPTRVSSMQGAS